MTRKHRNIGNRVQLVVDEVLHLLGLASSCSAHAARSRSLQLTKLEERMLMSASPIAMAVETATVAMDALPFTVADSISGTEFANAVTDYAETTVFEDVPTVGPSQVLTASRGIDLIDIDSRVQDAATHSVAKEVVIIDSGVTDRDQLLADLQAQRGQGRSLDIIVLQANRDGIDQISEALSGYQQLDAVHIVSHATDRGVKLGSTWLTNESLSGNAGAIANWGWALSSDADHSGLNRPRGRW